VIDGTEVESKSRGFEKHIGNVERDYEFGWLICGLFIARKLKTM
jgi:hypothetical protein